MANYDSTFFNIRDSKQSEFDEDMRIEIEELDESEN
jgi:hypothetical protein